MEGNYSDICITIHEHSTGNVTTFSAAWEERYTFPNWHLKPFDPRDLYYHYTVTQYFLGYFQSELETVSKVSEQKVLDRLQQVPGNDLAELNKYAQLSSKEEQATSWSQFTRVSKELTAP